MLRVLPVTDPAVKALAAALSARYPDLGVDTSIAAATEMVEQIAARVACGEVLAVIRARKGGGIDWETLELAADVQAGRS